MKPQDPEVLKKLDTYLAKGLLRYYLEIGAEKFEGYANHSDNEIKYYDLQMNPVHTLDKADITIVNYNPNHVLGIITIHGSIYMER